MTLVGKILTVLIFLMSVLFLGFAVMNFATQRDYRALINGADGTQGLQTQLRETQQKVQERQDRIQQTKYRLDLERAARRNALAVLEMRARNLVGELEAVQADYAKLANEQRELNENVKSVQDEIKRLKGEVDTVRSALTATIDNRNGQLKQVAELTDKINQSEGALRRLRERNQQFTGLRNGI